jgi:GR25 family glycosyltransferase involved in LPS biosynthesis
MIDQLNKLGIIKYTFFDAIKITKTELNQYSFIKSEKFLNFLNIDYVINSAGCKISHYKLIKSLMENSSKYTLILEDDAVLESNFYAYILNALYILQSNQLLYDFDLLYLGCNLNNKNDAKLIFPNLLKVEYPKTTTAYLINNHSTCKNKIINAIENSFNEIDNTYADSVLLNKYCIYPMIAYQKDFSSDIVDDADYKYYHENFTYNLV